MNFGSHSSNRLANLGLLGLGLVIACASSAAAQGERRFDELEGVEIEQHLEAELPLMALFEDEEGTALELGDLFGDLPVILTLNYVDCPQLCSMQLSQLAEAMAAMDLSLGVDYRVVTISIEPKDSLARLAEMRDRYVGDFLDLSRDGAIERDAAAATAGWSVLRGTREDIDRVAVTVGFGYRELPVKGGRTDYAHQATNILCSPSGVVSRYLPGVSVDMSDTLRLSLIDAGEGKIGSLFENAFLYCFIYDSSTGQYTPAVWRLLRAAAALTVIAVASGIFFMKRGDAQRGPSEGVPAADANEGEQRS